MVRFETSHGSFTIELFPKEAPVTVENFLKICSMTGSSTAPFFTASSPALSSRAAGLTADFDNKETRDPIKNEAKKRTQEWPRLAFDGAHGATSTALRRSFSVNLSDNAFLDHGPRDYGYAVFGRVTEGIETVDKIAKVKTGRRKGYQDAPLTMSSSFREAGRGEVTPPPRHSCREFFRCVGEPARFVLVAHAGSVRCDSSEAAAWARFSSCSPSLYSRASFCRAWRC